MTKSFKKAVACMLAVIMVAFSVPFSAFASQTVAQYHPDLELQFGAFFDPNAGDYAATPDADPANGAYAYSSLFAPALDATIQKDTTNGGISVSQLKFTASKYAAYNDFWNEYAELADTEDEIPAPDTDYTLGAGDYFWVTARLDSVDVVTYISSILTYSNNIEPAGYFSYKPKTKQMYAWASLSEAAALDTKGNGSWQFGGSTPVSDLSANAIYPGLNATELSSAQPMIENDGATGRMFICVIPDEGDPIATPSAASPDSDWTFANPTTGALEYEYEGDVICATWLFKVMDDFDANDPIEFGLYNPNDRVYYDDNETIEYELGGGHEGGSYTQEDVPMPSTYATYAPEAQTPASEKFLIFGMNIHSGEGCSGEQPHEHSYTAVETTAATCTEAGLMTYTCSCGDSYTETIPALGHAYDDGVVTPPTCTEAGYTTFTCSRCNDSYTEAGAAALGHDWGQWVVDPAPTCVAAGTQTRTCSRCQATESETVAATGIHSYTSVVTAPTCTEAGYTTYTCSVCGDEYTEAGDAALGHDFGQWVEITPATEENTGLKRRECSRCDAYEEEVIPKLDHVHIPGEAQNEDVVAATCTEAGSYNEVVRCTQCNEIISSTPHTVPALGHDWGEFEEVTAATCTDAGEKARTCSRCDAIDTDVIPALGHDYQSVVTAPTCTEAGYTTYTCSRCNDSYTEAGEAALGHDMGEWTVVTAATKTSKGLKKRECSRCDFEETEEVASLPILVTVKGSENGTVSGDFTVAGADVTQEYTFGQQYTFTATAKEGYKFDGWKIGGKNVSTSATYRSKAYADVEIEALYSKTTVEQFDVVFYDLYKNVVKVQTVSSAAEIEAPTASEMARSGFVFTGWNKNLETITGAVEVTGVYEPDQENGYTVTVEGAANATIDGAAATVKENIPYDSKVTVAAEGAKGWKIGETVVSTSEEYTFYVGSNVTVTAVFDAVEAVPAITIVNVKPIAGSDFKYQFIATRLVPSGYKLEKVGFVYGKNLADDELTLDKVGQQGKNDNAGKIKAGYNNITDANETSLSYGLTAKDGNIKAKAFMVVSKNGVQSVIYSDIAGWNYYENTGIGGGIQDAD